ncbi:MAG TPA: cyclic nucleotide-binding domain-containing protein [Vicinamibacteria bacterium]|nr:cyclic nucleotide-binding domain-containing protein [Vicinamibacteria bacterium]
MNRTTRIPLEDGARVAVLGGGPSGSFFTYFLCQMAQRAGRDVRIDLYEPRDFRCTGPRGCNMCGGVISESLMQSLATEGIQLPAGVVQRRIDSYFLHMDVGSVRVMTPVQEMRIAAIARGGGPRGAAMVVDSFDAFLFERAIQMGARHVPERATAVELVEGRPRVRSDRGSQSTYDLLVGAIGVNSVLLKSLDGLQMYRPPLVTKAYVAEFILGEEMIRRYLGSSMHVFLLDIPRLDFAALIPKRDFVTVCLLGDQIDGEVVERFLGSEEVRQVLPPHWERPSEFCHCSPRLNVQSATHSYGDRVVFIGDCGTTRLFKDGIGAAYRTAKAAARTAVFCGVAAEDFRDHFSPTCRRIHTDNRIGKVVFGVTRQIQRRRYARRALWRMTSREQKLSSDKRRMSRVLWDTFTGSAPYSKVLLRSLHPAFLGRFGLELVAGLRSGGTIRPRERVQMATGGTGLTSWQGTAHQVIYRQGEPGGCMYLLHSGKLEIVREQGGEERRLAILAGGSFFGETALLGELPRNATARLLEPSVLYDLKRTSLLARIHEEPSMAFRLVEHLARRVGEVEAALVSAVRVKPKAWEPVRPASALGPHPATPVVAAGQMGRRFEPGEVIYRQGDRGDCMYILLSGEVELTRRAGGQEYLLALLGPGEYFGEMALFHQEIRPHVVRAIKESYVFTLERNGLLRRVHEDPSMALQLIHNLVGRLSALEDVLFLQSASAPGAVAAST